MEKVVMITGATSGIGKATAILLAEHGYNIIIAGRRAHILSEMEKTLRSKTKVLALGLDITDNKQIMHVVNTLPNEWKKIDILINNAGLASGFCSIDKGLLEDWEIMIDTNIKGLLYISKAIIPLMNDSPIKQIINIGSIAGKEVYPNGNIYCATKAAVDAITKAMRIDLLEKGFKVTAIHPGMVETEFSFVRFNGDAERAKKVYEGFTPLKSEDIADIIHYVISLPEHVNINELIVMPKEQANATIVHRENKL
jgi:NADP-dependent 3-hydroxy acid dehydrogenase YdfG